MQNLHFRQLFIAVFLVIDSLQNIQAGPPFFTDDPQPVEYKHLEYYISSVHQLKSGELDGTLPHFEINYGLVPNVQIHLLLPLNYSYSNQQGLKMGYANTEFGVKCRFVQETEGFPQIGIFPIAIIPTIKNVDFGSSNIQLFLPVWGQKSWGKLTTYGGAGYWISRGENHQNSLFAGWEVQYDLSRMFTFGGEVFYHSADTVGGEIVVGCNLGGFVNFSNKFHIIYSLGHSLLYERNYYVYAGLLWTI